jgi:hypothetical protein
MLTHSEFKEKEESYKKGSSNFSLSLNPLYFLNQFRDYLKQVSENSEVSNFRYRRFMRSM